MSMNRKSLSRLVAAAGLAGVLALPALAQPMPDRHHGDGHRPPGAFVGAEGPVPPFLRRLDLTEAQRDRVFDILHAQAPDMRRQAKSLHKARQELRDLALSDRYDEGRAKGLADAAAQAMAGMALLRARSDHAIFALLTPEQRQEMAAARPAERRRAMPMPGDLP